MLEREKERIEGKLGFKYIEGNLIKAMKRGDWLLLDEINLASSDVLQKLLPILEKEEIQVQQKHKGQTAAPGFRIIGCMNPGSDVGKKELPLNIKNKFTELYVPEISHKEDIYVIVEKKLQKIKGFSNVVNTYHRTDLCESIVELYLEVKEKSERY